MLLDLLEFSLGLYEPALQIYAVLWLVWIICHYGHVKVSGLELIIQVCLYNWTAILCTPVYVVGFPIFYAVRFGLNTYIKWESNGKVSIMPGSDAVWGTESFANACNFTSLYILEGTCDRDKVTSKMLRGIVEHEIGGEKIYEKLKWRAGSRLGYPVWERLEETFDINRHIRFLHEWKGNGRMRYSEDEVFDEISSFFDHPLPLDKPQWEVFIVPEYVYNDSTKHTNNYYALIFRIHHSIMDGVSAGFALQNAIADNPPRLTVNPLAPLKMTPIERLMGYVAILVFGFRDAVRSFTLVESNCFHGPQLTGPKKLGWSRPVKLDGLKAMKNVTRTSTTAVLMSAIGASLRSLATKKKLKVPDKIHASLTVAILPYPDTKPQNRFTVVLFPLNLAMSSTIDRIKATYKSGQRLARSSEALVNFYLMRLLGQSCNNFCRQFNRLLHSTMLLSNVPGPAETVTLFGGDRLADVAFWTPLRNCIGVSMSLFSYAGKIRVGMVGDSVVFPDPNDVPTLISEFEKEIIRTGVLAGIEEVDCFTKC